MSWARRSNSALTAALRPLSGKPVVREAGRALGQPGRLSGRPGPVAERRDPCATPRSYRGERGDAPRKARYAMSLIPQRWGHILRRQTVSANVPMLRGRSGNSRATSRTVAAARWTRGSRGSPPAMWSIARTGIQSRGRRHCRWTRSPPRGSRPLPERQAAAAALHGSRRTASRATRSGSCAPTTCLKAFGGPSKLTGTTLPGRHSRRPRAEPPAISPDTASCFAPLAPPVMPRPSATCLKRHGENLSAALATRDR